MLYKRVLVSDVLDHIGRIYSPLNLANIKIKKFKFVRNTCSAPDNQRVLIFMRSPKLSHILVNCQHRALGFSLQVTAVLCDDTSVFKKGYLGPQALKLGIPVIPAIAYLGIL